MGFVHRIECQRSENNLAGAKQPGDEAMQSTIDFWEKHQPDSALEVLEIGRQDGIKEGMEKGMSFHNQATPTLADAMIRSSNSLSSHHEQT